MSSGRLASIDGSSSMHDPSRLGREVRECRHDIVHFDFPTVHPFPAVSYRNDAMKWCRREFSNVYCNGRVDSMACSYGVGSVLDVVCGGQRGENVVEGDSLSSGLSESPSFDVFVHHPHVESFSVLW